MTQLIVSLFLMSPCNDASARGFSTRAVHAGLEADPNTGAVIPPISVSTTFKQSAAGVHLVKRPRFL